MVNGTNTDVHVLHPLLGRDLDAPAASAKAKGGILLAIQVEASGSPCVLYDHMLAHVTVAMIADLARAHRGKRPVISGMDRHPRASHI